MADIPTTTTLNIDGGPRYPVEVRLTGTDGNAFAIMGKVRRALRRHLAETDVPPEEAEKVIEAFTTEATAGDYDHLLRTCMTWVEVS